MTILNLENKFDTGNVTNMGDMFCWTGYSSMITLNLGDKFDTSKVTNMVGMFKSAGTGKMQVLNLGDNVDTSNVTDMTYMFHYTGYDAMSTLDLGPAFKNIPSAPGNYRMFYESGQSGCQIKVSSDIKSEIYEYTKGTIVSAY